MSKRKKLLASSSVLVHVAIAGALAFMSLWEIAEVSRPGRVASVDPFFFSSGGQKEEPAGARVEPKKKEVTVRTQPNRRPDDAPEVTGGGKTAGSKIGGGGGPDIDGPPAVGIGPNIGICIGPDCEGATIIPDPLIVQRPAKEVDVPPAVLSALERISGEAKIQPPTSTQNAISHSKHRRVVAVIRVCLDKQGRVHKQKVVKSSTYPAYDAKLLSKIRQWRYHPYHANGVAIAICSHVTFIYYQG